MYILTAAEMAETDERSVASGVPVAALMENAGGAVARFCLSRFAHAERIAVLCGKGNNGGDGMVAARRLAESGARVRVLLLGSANDLKGAAGNAYAAAALTAKALYESGQGRLELHEVRDEAQLRAELQDADLVLDAVVGTGFKPPLRGLAEYAAGVLAETGVPVVAVDLPSGWDADCIEANAPGAFRADAVVTFVAPKQAHVFGQLTASSSGAVVVAEIGTPPGALACSEELRWAGPAKGIAEEPRKAQSNKGMYGHVLLIGGALGKAGAPSMSSLAALRAGAGLVTAAVPREILSTVAASAPELMLTPLEAQGPSSRVQGPEGGLALEQLEGVALERLLKGISLVAMGPGLGQEGSTPEFVRRFLERVPLPMVLDADALNAIAGHTHLLKDIVKMGNVLGTPRTIVLTPHPGEMARLAGLTVAEVEADRLGLARRFAKEFGVTLVLKGWRTLIAHPDGRVAVNTTGNPSMAKGGSGDILTGVVAAMLAQYANAKEKTLTAENVALAVEAAVCLHGLAGDFAAEAQEEHTVLATDTVAHLCDAFRLRLKDEDGLTWITGAAAR